MFARGNRPHKRTVCSVMISRISVGKHNKFLDVILRYRIVGEEVASLVLEGTSEALTREESKDFCRRTKTRGAVKTICIVELTKTEGGERERSRERSRERRHRQY